MLTGIPSFLLVSSFLGHLMRVIAVMTRVVIVGMIVVDVIVAVIMTAAGPIAVVAVIDVIDNFGTAKITHISRVFSIVGC